MEQKVIMNSKNKFIDRKEIPMWIELSDNPQSITNLYLSPPKLQGVRTLRLFINEDGPSMRANIDLPKYPDNPPKKWAISKYNSAQVEIYFYGVDNFSIQGWNTDNILDYNFEQKNEAVIKVSAKGKSCSIDFECIGFMIERVSGGISVEE